MKSLHMQHFMSNRTIGKVVICRGEKQVASSPDLDLEHASPGWSPFVQPGIEDHLYFNARAFLYLANEVSDWLTKSVKILGLHKSMILHVSMDRSLNLASGSQRAVLRKRLSYADLSIQKVPMVQTYSQLQKQIAALQQKADAIRAKEVDGVIDRIKVAISHYELTPEQLFGGKASAKKTAAPTTKASVRKSDAKKVGRISYSDGGGNTWGGWGKRPNWLREALASGRRLEDFQVGASIGGAAKKATRKTAQKRRPSSMLYSDGAGKSWTGRGPQPRWLKEAVAGGKSLEDLRAS
jgi:DNA-binding protein H-NS